MKKFALALAAASISVTGMAAPAFASETKSVNVRYDDLNLNTVSGQETLERRLEKAAKQVCGYDDHKTGSRIRSLVTRQCLAKARAAAKQQFAAVMEDQRRGG